MVKIELEDNAQNGQFVLYEDAAKAGEMTFYRNGDDTITIDHTNVGEAFGGKGYGKQLVKAAISFARSSNIMIVPECPFVKAVFDKDDTLQDVKA